MNTSFTYFLDLEAETQENKNYRTVISTTKDLQLVLMSIPVGGYIKLEIHEHTTQFIRVESGLGRAFLDFSPPYQKQDTMDLPPGSCVIIPPGTWHKISNIGDTPLKLYTIYSPPEHPSNLVQMTKPVDD